MLDLISSGRCLHDGHLCQLVAKREKNLRRRRKNLQVIRGVGRKMCSAAARNPLMWGQARLHYSGSAGFAFRLEGLPQVADRDIFR